MKHAHPFKMIVGKTSSVLLTFFFLCQQTWFFKCILQGFIFEAAIFVSRSQMGWCGETEFQGEGVGYACRSKKRLNRQVIKFPNLWKEKKSLQIFKKIKNIPYLSNERCSGVSSFPSATVPTHRVSWSDGDWGQSKLQWLQFYCQTPADQTESLSSLHR